MSVETYVNPLPLFCVGQEIVNTRVSLYQRAGGKHEALSKSLANKPGVNSLETKFVWYPRYYFEKLLEEMNHYHANGVRIYFGEYESGHQAAGQLGLLLVLTETRDGKIKDLLYESQEDFVARKSIPQPKKAVFPPRQYGPEVEKEFNVCAPCPPICINHEPHFPENDVSYIND